MTAPRRQSPAVYRRRRIVVFGGLLLVIVALVALLVWQPWRSSGGDGPAATPTPTVPRSTGATAAPDGKTPAVEGTQPCNDSQVTVTGKTDKTAYAAGENPRLSMTLANTSSAGCTIDVGTAAQVFSVSSGSDVWWRSTDCQGEPASQVITLKAGRTIDSAEGGVEWQRVRSSPDTCEVAERPAAPGGGSTYRLTVSIGGIQSAETAAFTLD